MNEQIPNTLRDVPLKKGYEYQVENTISLDVGTIRGTAAELLLEPGDIIKIINPKYIAETLLVDVVDVNHDSKNIMPGYDVAILIKPNDLEKIHVSERES